MRHRWLSKLEDERKDDIKAVLNYMDEIEQTYRE